MNYKTILQPLGQPCGCSRRQFLGGALSAAAAAPLLAAVAGQADTAEARNEMTAWHGPQSTSKELGIDTPLPYLNSSWKVAVELLDRGRQLYHEGKSLCAGQPDRLGGFPGAWLPVNIGRNGPLVYPWDTRDIRHIGKMIAYLWAEEPGLAGEYQKNLFLDEIRPDGSFGEVETPWAQHLAMYASSAADLPTCFGGIGPRAGEVFRRAAAFVRNVCRRFDPEGSGLLSVRSSENVAQQTFWGIALGEFPNFPPNYDGKAKSVTASMALAVFCKRLRDAALAFGAEKEARDLDAASRRLSNAIEERAWNPETRYYYLQRDFTTNRWFHSINGICEASRETNNTANYAAEVCQKPERAEAVALYIQQVLLRERVFPMPMQWPTYAWYSPQSPNYIDLGTDCGPMGGCWDTSYFHCVQVLERVGLQEAIQRAVLRRAEVIHRDGDCLEYFRPDGTVDYSRHFVRSGYIVSGTAHVAAIVEGLFGVTPAKVRFEELNLRPNLPLYRRHRHSQFPSPWAQRDNRLTIELGPKGRLEMTVRYDEETETLWLRTNAVGVLAHVRLPVDLAGRVSTVHWGGKKVAYRLEHGVDSDFLHVDHMLDGGELRVALNPHPQKGQHSPKLHPDPSILR